MALEAFALAIAPLPGVTVPTGSAPNLNTQVDATFAVMWIMRYLDQLTPEQHAVVDPILAADPTAPRITPGAAGAAPPTSLQQPRVVLAAYTAMSASDYLDLAEKYEQQIASEIGRQLSMDLTLTLDKVQVNGKDGVVWWAYSVPVKNTNDCALHVEPVMQNSTDAAAANATMAHEIFHCFQFDYARQIGLNANSIADWVLEGQAEWVGETLGGPTNIGRDWWVKYLDNYATPLFARDYDAVGFYQHMSEEGINPWTHFDNMIAGYKQSNNVGAYEAASGSDENFLDTWASGIFRREDLGSAWFATGPWTVTGNPNTTEVTINDDGIPTDEDAEAVTNNLVTAAVTADILEVESTGHVRLKAPPVPDLPTTQRWLCFDPNECKCPPGKEYQGPNSRIRDARRRQRDSRVRPDRGPGRRHPDADWLADRQVLQGPRLAATAVPIQLRQYERRPAPAHDQSLPL